MPQQILENWEFPVLSFFRNLFGRNQLTWANVIDPNKTTGNPPNLRTNVLKADGTSQPFTIRWNGCIKFRQVFSSQSGQVFIDSTRELCDTYINMPQSHIDDMATNSTVWTFTLLEIKGSDDLINRYMPRRSGIPG